MTLKPITESIDQIWALRRKPIGWLLIGVLALVAGWTAVGQAQDAIAWKKGVDTHLERAPKVEAEARDAWKDVKSEIQAVKEKQGEMEAADAEFRAEYRRDIRALLRDRR